MDEIDEQADHAAGVGKAQQFHRTRRQAARGDGGDEAAETGIVPGIIGMTPTIERRHFVQPVTDIVQPADADI
ncbi:hypothetical protein LTR94_038068, partial [Friedmanniomyces endolithicus]